MDHCLYQTSQFAQKASVSVRTLRHYDKLGLLSPTQHTKAGYRLYSDQDFFRLQRILALKFLGFSLEEIRHCLRTGPQSLQDSLIVQKMMLREQRQHLDAIIQAIDKTEKLLQAQSHDWEAIIHVIQVMQMEQKDAWQKRYFTEEQLQKMEDLSSKAYTEEQRQQIAKWGQNFSEADQLRANEQWEALTAELKSLVGGGTDPTSAPAQALAARWFNQISQFTHGDPGVLQGLKNWYREFDKLPAQEAPFPLPYTQEENAFIQKALEIYHHQNS